MERISEEKPGSTYYNGEHEMQITLTSTNEKTFQEAENELIPLLEEHYITRVLALQRTI